MSTNEVNIDADVRCTERYCRSSGCAQTGVLYRPPQGFNPRPNSSSSSLLSIKGVVVLSVLGSILGSWLYFSLNRNYFIRFSDLLESAWTKGTWIWKNPNHLSFEPPRYKWTLKPSTLRHTRHHQDR